MQVSPPIKDNSDGTYLSIIGIPSNERAGRVYSKKEGSSFRSRVYLCAYVTEVWQLKYYLHVYTLCLVIQSGIPSINISIQIPAQPVSNKYIIKIMYIDKYLVYSP